MIPVSQRQAGRPIPVDKQAIREMAERLSAKLLEQLEEASPDLPVRERQVWVQDQMPVRAADGEERDAIVVVRGGPGGQPGPYVDAGGFGWHQSGRPVVIVSLNGNYTPAELSWSLRGSPQLIQDMMYTTLLHEVTHAADVHRDKPGYTLGKASEQYTTEDLDRYYNDPHEVRAFMQQVVDEVEETFGYRQDDVLDKFGESRGLKMMLNNSATWREVKPHLNEDSKRKVLRAVHRAVSERRERSRAKKSEPADDFWTWMSRTQRRVPNPNPQGRSHTITPATLRGYAEDGEHKDRARKIVDRYMSQYQKRDQEREVAASWLRKAAYRKDFLDAVKGQKFRNPDTNNDVLFVSLPRKEQARIYRQWLDVRGPETEEEAPITAPASPERYEHVDFNLDEEEEKLVRRVMGLGRGSSRDRLLDLAGMGPLAAHLREVDVSVEWDDTSTTITINGNGGYGLYFERVLRYSNPPGKRSKSKPDKVTNYKIELDWDAPEGIGTRMLMGQVLAAEREGFGVIETEAQGSPGSEWSGYYVWPRLGYDGELEPETIDKMPAALRQKIEKLARSDGSDPRFSHLMMLPEGRKWWRDNGHSVDLEFDTHAESRSRKVLDAYFRERAKRAGKTPMDYLLRSASLDAPKLDEEDDVLLDQLWDAIRESLPQTTHVASELSDFRQTVEGKKFRNPDTGNEVLFQSLPRVEQAKLFAEWRRRQRGQEPRRERVRGLIQVDKDDARKQAKHIAEKARSWKVRDPDERIGDRWLPAMGRGEITMGTVDFTDVRGRRFERPLRLGMGEPNPGLWRVGRKFVTGGRVVHRQAGKDDPGTPMYVQVDLNPDSTYRELAEAGTRLEDEIYNVLIHEMTHARDVVMTQKELERHKQRHITPEDTPDALRTEAQNHEYYNKPTEVRAFKQQVADEVRRELEKLHKVHDFKRDLAEKKKEQGENVDFDDDPDWIPMDAEAVMRLLGRSVTWDRVRYYLTPQNRRKFLETAASVVRTFKEERGGKVARVFATWMSRMASRST